MGTIQLTHNALTGITRAIDGIISAIGNSLILAIRRPVGSSIKPPPAQFLLLHDVLQQFAGRGDPVSQMDQQTGRGAADHVQDHRGHISHE